MNHVFPSVRSDQHAFVVYESHNEDLWNSAYRHCVGPLSPNFGVFDTLGDGLTQHSPERAVTKTLAGDFFESFARYLLSIDPKDEKIARDGCEH